MKSLPLSQVVNVQLNIQPMSQPRRDFGLLALFTPETGEAFEDGDYVEVTSQADVESLFGTNSITAKATIPFWSQTPRPTRMMIVKWNRASEQTLVEAMHNLTDQYPFWYAAVPAVELDDQEIDAAADWILAADKKILGLTTTNKNHLQNVPENIFKRLAGKNNYRVVAIYDNDDPHAIMAWLARALSVNFSANNSTLTMKFKQLLGITPTPMTLTDANKASALGINYYTYFDDSAMVAEGTVVGGRYFDEVHILDWFVDAVQKEIFAVLYRSPTKIPLTDPGTERLLSAVRRVCREGIKNGAFAPGVWNGDPFGTLNSGDRLDEGFYVWADTVDNLSTSDREKRKGPPLQAALKFAGAIHNVDVIVNFDR